MALTDTAVSFAAYKDRATGANLDLRPTAELMAEADAAEREILEGGAVNGP